MSGMEKGQVPIINGLLALERQGVLTVLIGIAPGPASGAIVKRRMDDLLDLL